MAENDNVELDTSVFVKHLSRAYDGPRFKKRGQTSASFESHASHHGSSGSKRYSRSTKSMDDNLDPRNLLLQALNSRQGTSGSSDDYEESEDVKNASMESLFSGSDRDSELESIAICDYDVPNHCGYKMRKRPSGNLANSSSLSDLNRLDKIPADFNYVLKTRRKSVSLIDLSTPIRDCDHEERPSSSVQDEEDNFFDDELYTSNFMYTVETL